MKSEKERIRNEIKTNRNESLYVEK
jgi:hypothetical protein